MLISLFLSQHSKVCICLTRQTDRQTVSSVLYQVTDVSTVMEKVFFNETVNYEPLESLVHFLIFLNSSEPVVFLISEHDIFSHNGTITTISTKTKQNPTKCYCSADTFPLVNNHLFFQHDVS